MATDITYDVHRPPARGAERSRLPRAGAALVTPNAISVAALMTVVGVVYLALSWNHRAPQIYWDEAGTLGNARWLAGGSPWWMGNASPFQLGYPLLIAPVFAFVHSPVAIYRTVMAVNALLCALLAGLLYLIARQLVDAPPKVALATSLIACAYPSIAVQSGIAWVELPAMVAIALFVLTGWWMFRRPGYATMLGHAAVAAYLWLLHGRFIAVPAVLVVLLGYLAVRHRRLRAPAIAAIAFTLVAVLAAHLAQSAVQHARWDPGYPSPPTLHQILHGIPVALIRQLSGQVFYILVATMGLAAIGTATMARAFVESHRHGVDDKSPHWLERSAGSIYIFVALGSVVLVAAATMAAGNPGRFNFSGRYSDPLTPTFLALGLAALLTRGRLVIVRSLWIAAGTILATGLVIVSIDRARSGTDLVRWVTAPAVRPFFAGGTSWGADAQNGLHSDAGILALTLTATVLVALLAFAARRLRWSIGVFALCVFLAVATVDVRFMSGSARRAEVGTASYFVMRARHPRTIAYDLDDTGIWSYFGMPFWLNESTFVGYRSSAATWPKADMYIGPPVWPQAVQRGLRRLLVDPLSHRGVWVRVGT